VFLTFLVSLFLFDRAAYYLFERLEYDFYRDGDFKTRFTEYARDKKLNTLILGTSRTFEAIHPLYFRTILNENAYKEAQFGKNPKYNYFFYNFFKKNAGTPEFVVYGIDYFIFNSRSNRRWLARLGKLHDPVPPFSAPSLLLANKQGVENFIEAVTQRWNKTFSPEESKSVMDFIDLQKYVGTPHKPGIVVTEKKRNFWRQKYPRFPGKEGRYLRSLLHQLNQDGVTTFLVLIPNHFGTYRTNFDRQALKRDLFQLRRGLKHVHILILDTPEHFPLDKAEYFINGGWGRTNCHVSRSGARLFNRILIDKLRPYYRKRRRAKARKVEPKEGPKP